MKHTNNDRNHHHHTRRRTQLSHSRARSNRRTHLGERRRSLFHCRLPIGREEALDPAYQAHWLVLYWPIVILAKFTRLVGRGEELDYVS